MPYDLQDTDHWSNITDGNAPAIHAHLKSIIQEVKMSRDLKVGDKASVSKIFTDEDVLNFSNLSLDKNPIHLDQSFAEKSIFGKKIAHGMLVASLFSGLLGMKLPGEGTIYLGQSLSFLVPIYIGDEVTATVEVIKIRPDKPIVTMRTFCVNSEGLVVIEGEAVVKVA